MLVVLVGVLAGVLMQLPTPFSDRLAVIPESSSIIDNVKPYDSVAKWAVNGSLAGLHLMNPTRVRYFDERIRLHLQPPFRLLDAGCGGGLVSNALARLSQDYDIYGVDLSTPALAFAEHTANAQSLSNVQFGTASVYELPFQKSSFDAVVISDVLEHLHDIPKALRELARVLRPGGVLLFDTLDRSVFTFIVAIAGAERIVGITERGTHDWRLFLRPEELERGLAGAGLDHFLHEALEPSIRALAELSLFSLGLLDASYMSAGWSILPPSSAMISYIGSAVKAP